LQPKDFSVIDLIEIKYCLKQKNFNRMDSEKLGLLLDHKEPKLPSCFVIPESSKLQTGTVALFKGVMPSDQGRFRIDLLASACQHICKSKNLDYDPKKRIIVLHFNVRCGEGPNGSSYILMDNFANEKWMGNQRCMDFPFESGQKFSLSIDMRDDRFEIRIESLRTVLLSYKNNFELCDITCIHVEGPNFDCNQFELWVPKSIPNPANDSGPDKIVEKFGLEKIFQNPEVPLFEYLKNLDKLSELHIEGELLDPFTQYFVINLSRTENQNEKKRTNIILHLSVRALHQKLIRNSLIEGTWGQEETCLDEPLDCLRPGSQFTMNYKHRTDPNSIDTLEIFGSVRLKSICIKFNQ
ncbi:hypothetical protein SSS_04025, partial [Sarcoptes scabiei]